MLPDWWALQGNKWVWNQFKLGYCCGKLKYFQNKLPKALVLKTLWCVCQGERGEQGEVGPNGPRGGPVSRCWPSAVLDFLSWLNEERTPEVNWILYFQSCLDESVTVAFNIASESQQLCFFNICLLKSGEQVLRLACKKKKKKVSRLKFQYCKQPKFFTLIATTTVFSSTSKQKTFKLHALLQNPIRLHAGCVPEDFAH